MNFFKKNKLNIISVLISLALIVGAYSIDSEKAKGISIISTLIGGETNGVTDVCCDGVVLDFDSVNPLNIYLLDGEALWVPGLTSSYDNDNEFSEGYNTIGSLTTFICLDITEECESGSEMPYISLIGTSAD